MINRTLVFTSLFLLAATAHPALVGSTVELAHRFEARTDASAVISVADGAADAADMYLGSRNDGPVGYWVDLDGNQVRIDFYLPRFTTSFSRTATVIGAPPYINGLLISGEGFDAFSFRDTATILQAEFAFVLDRIVVYDAHTAGLDFQQLEFGNESSLQILFGQASAMPTPATFMLAALGLSLIVAARRARPTAG